jgi:hypothetical protein
MIILVGMGVFSTPYSAIFAASVSAKLKPASVVKQILCKMSISPWMKHLNQLQY